MCVSVQRTESIDPLELEFQIVVSGLMGMLWTHSGSSGNSKYCSLLSHPSTPHPASIIPFRNTVSYLIYSSLFSSVTRILPPLGFKSWLLISPRISLSTEKYISKPHSSILFSLHKWNWHYLLYVQLNHNSKVFI